jgi:exonuclease SbcC
LPPRGGVGDTRVALVLEDPRDRARYVIERIRRRRGVDAEIYRQDEDEAPIVKGTRDVTDYVTHRLIGLSHRAFVSTFFTRQKELSFFGDLRDTERRREVAQLLGFETIRAAQNIIGDDRTEARNDAQGLARQYQDESKDRDFPAELTAAEAGIVNATEAEGHATRQREQIETAYQQARAELERLTAIERRYAALSQDIERLSGELSTAQANRQNAETHLARLDTLGRTRQELLPRAEAEPVLREALLRHEAEQARFRHCQALAESITQATRLIVAAGDRAEELVRSIPTNGVPIDGWHWYDDDGELLEPAIDRLLGTVDLLDPKREADIATSLRSLADAVARRDEARTKADRYTRRLAAVEGEIRRLLDAGDPRTELETMAERREGLLDMARTAATTGRDVLGRRQELLQTVQAIHAAAREPECPTCHRPLSAADAEIAIAPLEAQIEDLESRHEQAKRAKQDADEHLARLDTEADQVKQRLSTLQDLEGRCATGLEMVAEAEAEAAQRAETCVSLLATLGRTAGPSSEELAAVIHRADLVKAISGQRAGLLHLRTQLADATASRTQARQDLEQIGTVNYDPEAHQRAVQALDAARSAVARMAQIDSELARRADYQARLNAATEAGVRVSEALTATRAERDGLGFDRAALDQTERTERESLAAAREAERAVSAARSHLERAVRDREAIVAEQERLTNLARRAETRRREYDELDRMYREFSRFDQYVAQLVTPQLADYTSELLAEVTDHKYDQVIFDDNYGVRIFDGPEDFPIDQFSGGERDVAALCARLALSRFIGAQAAHPPRFLVLDEVFGSLDAERRAHVLSALLKLAGTDGPFRQLFIISHVDDIRLSPALDEVWRVHEVDGASRVENLVRAGIVDEV